MPVGMNIWRIDAGQPRRLREAVLPNEASLEEVLEKDPSLLGSQLMVIGRQVPTAFGTYLDLLAMDEDGTIYVLELKRDRTPRDVIAQLLDYASWVSQLGRDEVIEIANQYLNTARSQQFEAAFEETFGITAPDELSVETRLFVVAAELDPASERIVSYLAEFGVPINVVLFSYLEDDGRQYLARTWFVDPEDVGIQSRATATKKAPWNGRDWYVSFGDAGDGLGRSWDDAFTYNFVSAGGDPWYSRTLRTLPVGARVNVHLPKVGYVAVGTVLDAAARIGDAKVKVDDRWIRLADQPLLGSYRHADGSTPVTAENDEYVVPVEWTVRRPRTEAFWKKGMFANQNSACKLRQQFTLDALADEFDLDESD